MSRAARFGEPHSQLNHAYDTNPLHDAHHATKWPSVLRCADGVVGVAAGGLPARRSTHVPFRVVAMQPQDGAR